MSNIFSLTNKEKKILLKIARSTLEQYLQGNKLTLPNIENENLKQSRGAFVTLKKYKNLCGCIGRIVTDQPLSQLISDVTIDSAIHDPRFNPIQLKDLQNIEIEISVLTPFQEIINLDEIIVGKHGLMIRKGYNSGLFLPQVPIEWHWDKNTYLEQLCLKAGLPISAYQDKKSTIYSFEAIVFSENEGF